MEYSNGYEVGRLCTAQTSRCPRKFKKTVTKDKYQLIKTNIMGRIGAPELLIIAIPFLALYFLPSFIALSRKKTNRTAIILLNFFLGWTFIGWIASLVWACTTNNEPQTIVVNNNPYSKEESPSHLQKNGFDEKLNSLQKLKDLLDSGVLSQEEFEQQKSKVLAS